MGLFDIFKDKNPNNLKPVELEAAELFQKIIKGYAQGEPNYIQGGIDTLSLGLYHAAFNRTNKRFVPLDQMRDPIKLVTNPTLMAYFNVFKTIKDGIKQTAENHEVQKVYHDIFQIRAATLEVLKFSADRINEI